MLYSRIPFQSKPKEKGGIHTQSLGSGCVVVLESGYPDRPDGRD